MGPQGPGGATGTPGVVGTVPVLSGYWGELFPYAAITTQTISVGLLRLSRTQLLQAVSNWQIEVTTAGATIVRLGVYADTASGPGSLLYQSADVDVSALGVKTIALAVPSGTYWVGVQNVGAATAGLRAVTGVNAMLPGTDPSSGGVIQNCWQAPGRGAALPNPIPPAAIQRQGYMFQVIFQAA